MIVKSVKSRRELATRISVSLPRDVSRGLDRLVEARGFESRSQAVASMVRETLLDDDRAQGDVVMAGSITLIFSQQSAGTTLELARLKRQSIAEVIGSLQVLLEDDLVLEVILVQGPVRTLEEITDALLTCKGVESGKLTLTKSLIPPLHPHSGTAS